MTNWKIDMKNNEPVAYIDQLHQGLQTHNWGIGGANQWAYSIRGARSRGILIRAKAFKSDLLQELLK